MAFKDDIKQGLTYTAVAKYFSLFISLLISAILARLLTPEDFAIIAIATVIIGFITLLTGSGLSPAIIQQRDLSNTDIENLFSFTFYLSILSALIFSISIPAISYFYENAILNNICFLLIINVIFSVINIVPNALLFKDKRFKYIAVRTIVVQTILGILSVVGALCGIGVYALLINPIIGSILLFIISYRCFNIKLRFRFDSTIIKQILPYSSYQIGFNLLNYGYRNTDTLLIGHYFSLNTLGYYEKSYRLMMLPLDNLSSVINPVLHPILSEYQDNHKFIFDKYKQLVGYLAYIGFMLSGFCFACASDIILTIFGDKWVASISIFKILSLSIGIQIVQSAIGSIFQSTGKVRLLFISGLLAFIITIVAIICGIMSSKIDILAILLVAAFTITFFIYHLTLIKFIMKESLSGFLKTLIRPIISGITVSVVLLVFKSAIHIKYPVFNLICCVIVSLLVVIFMQRVRLIVGIPDLVKIFFNQKRKC